VPTYSETTEHKEEGIMTRAIAIDGDTLIEIIAVDEAMAMEEAEGGFEAAELPSAEEMRRRLDGVGDTITQACDRVKRRIDSMANEIRPDKIEMEFGVSVTGRMKYVFVGAEGNSTFKVKVTWALEPDKSDDSSAA
jgi:hypothetical protein